MDRGAAEWVVDMYTVIIYLGSRSKSDPVGFGSAPTALRRYSAYACQHPHRELPSHTQLDLLLLAAVAGQPGYTARLGMQNSSVPVVVR